MTREELQAKIDKEHQDAKNMRKIGESYLRGDVIHDMVAAEAWLMKVIEQEDGKEAPIAMALIARNIMGKQEVFSDADYLDMKQRLAMAEGAEREELEKILSFASEHQTNL